MAGQQQRGMCQQHDGPHLVQRLDALEEELLALVLANGADTRARISPRSQDGSRWSKASGTDLSSLLVPVLDGGIRDKVEVPEDLWRAHKRGSASERGFCSVTMTHPDKRREGLHGLLLVVAVDLNDLKQGDLLHRLLAEGREDRAKRLDLAVLLLRATPVERRHESVEGEPDDLR